MKLINPTKLIIFSVFFSLVELSAQDKTIYILHTNNTNGALEKELIENCSTIIPGCELISIGEESIIGLNYDYALSKIKS